MKIMAVIRQLCSLIACAGLQSYRLAVELLPFRAAIEAGVDAIMTAHGLFPAMVQDSGLPATLVPTVLLGLPRNELGFSGLIVSDSLTVGAVDQRYGINLTTELAFRAGADILAFGADYNHTPAEQQPAYQHLLAQIRQDVTLQAPLDDSVRRILRIKLGYGLFDRQPADETTLTTQIGTAEHRTIAQQIAQQSITLLKDEWFWAYRKIK